MGISVNFPTDLLATQNMNAISLYVLSKDSAGNLVPSNSALKQNLQVFLSEYRMLTDAVNIKDAFIINIGVNFDIIVRPNYNNKLVVNNCLTTLQSYFDIDKWQINQPIILSDIYSILDQVEGVQTVQKVEIVNKAGTNLGYSQYSYDVKGATINNILYPSLDPSIFEVKNLTTDIQGRAVTF
jgi:phage-related baseplate assembly protein